MKQLFSRRNFLLLATGSIVTALPVVGKIQDIRAEHVKSILRTNLPDLKIQEAALSRFAMDCVASMHYSRIRHVLAYAKNLLRGKHGDWMPYVMTMFFMSTDYFSAREYGAEVTYRGCYDPYRQPCVNTLARFDFD